jgi:hypothetical protein
MVSSGIENPALFLVMALELVQVTKSVCVVAAPRSDTLTWATLELQAAQESAAPTVHGHCSDGAAAFQWHFGTIPI